MLPGIDRCTEKQVISIESSTTHYEKRLNKRIVALSCKSTISRALCDLTLDSENSHVYPINQGKALYDEEIDSGKQSCIHEC